MDYSEEKVSIEELDEIFKDIDDKKIRQQSEELKKDNIRKYNGNRKHPQEVGVDGKDKPVKIYNRDIYSGELSKIKAEKSLFNKNEIQQRIEDFELIVMPYNQRDINKNTNIFIIPKRNVIAKMGRSYIFEIQLNSNSPRIDKIFEEIKGLKQDGAIGENSSNIAMSKVGGIEKEEIKHHSYTDKKTGKKKGATKKIQEGVKEQPLLPVETTHLIFEVPKNMVMENNGDKETLTVIIPSNYGIYKGEVKFSEMTKIYSMVKKDTVKSSEFGRIYRKDGNKGTENKTHHSEANRSCLNSPIDYLSITLKIILMATDKIEFKRITKERKKNRVIITNTPEYTRKKQFLDLVFVKLDDGSLNGDGMYQLKKPIGMANNEEIQKRYPNLGKESEGFSKEQYFEEMYKETIDVQM